jgi:hypothetical protein
VYQIRYDQVWTWLRKLSLCRLPCSILCKFYFERTVQITWEFYASRRLKWSLPRFLKKSIQRFFSTKTRLLFL